MKKINKILLNEKAWIIAFIPTLNAAYITFWLMTYEGTYDGEKRQMKKVFSIISLAIGIPTMLLMLFTDWLWLVALLVGYVYEVVIAYYLLRESYGRYVFSKKSWVIPAILSVVALVVLILGIDLSTERENECRIAAEAFLENNSETWESMLHPDYADEIGNIGEIKEQFSKNVNITEDFELGKNTKYKGEFAKSVECHTYTFLLKGNDTIYELTLMYVENSSGEGITGIQIESSTYNSFKILFW